MAKPRKKLKVRIPQYVAPRLRWRKLIAEKARDEQRRCGVEFDKDEPLEVAITLYFKGRDLWVHDLDNRMKDIFDALQGRMGGSKKDKPSSPLIVNDNQVFKVIAEKSKPPRQSHDLGHLVVRRLHGKIGKD